MRVHSLNKWMKKKPVPHMKNVYCVPITEVQLFLKNGEEFKAHLVQTLRFTNRRKLRTREIIFPKVLI